MKKKNKGITLPEVLCYIVIFTMISLQVTSYIIVVNKYKSSTTKEKHDEILFVDDLLGDISDYLYLNDTTVYLKETEELLEAYAKNDNRLLFSYDKKTSLLRNEIEGRKKEVKYCYMINKGYYLLINTNNLNYNFVLKVG